MLQDMEVAACGNLVPVPLETRGRVSHSDENSFNQWCATEDTLSLFLKKKKKEKAKKNSRHHRTEVCFSPLWWPTLSSWDVLDLEITPLTYPYQGMLPVENNRTEVFYALLRFSFE